MESSRASRTSSAPENLQQRLQTAEAVRTLARAPESGVTSSGPLGGDQRHRQVHAAETHLLDENASTGVVATIVLASLLAYAQWDVVPHVVVSVWLLYVLLVSAARFMLVRRYWRASPSDTESGRWNVAFVVGAAMAAAGWGAAGIVLYPAARPMMRPFLCSSWAV
jgi:hypothetical protein